VSPLFAPAYASPSDYGGIDPSVVTALIQGGVAVATTGISAASVAAQAKADRKAASSYRSAPAAPIPVALPPAASSVPGWAVGLGAFALAGVVGGLLLRRQAPAHPAHPTQWRAV